MTTGQTTDEQSGELRCSCGYLFQGSTEKRSRTWAVWPRCPECGRPFPGKPRRRNNFIPYLFGGFLCGFGIVIVFVLLSWDFPVVRAEADVGERYRAGMTRGVLQVQAAVFSMVAGFIGMLIGYVVYRIRR